MPDTPTWTFTDYSEATAGSTPLPYVAEVGLHHQAEPGQTVRWTGDVCRVRWYPGPTGGPDYPGVEVFDDEWGVLTTSGLIEWFVAHDATSWTVDEFKAALVTLGWAEAPRATLEPRAELARGLERVKKRHAEACERLAAYLRADICARVLDIYPDADTLHVRGEWGANSYGVAVQMVTRQATVLAGEMLPGPGGQWPNDEWASLTDEVEPDVEYLHTLEPIEGDVEIPLRAEPSV